MLYRDSVSLTPLIPDLPGASSCFACMHVELGVGLAVAHYHRQYYQSYPHHYNTCFLSVLQRSMLWSQLLAAADRFKGRPPMLENRELKGYPALPFSEQKRHRPTIQSRSGEFRLPSFLKTVSVVLQCKCRVRCGKWGLAFTPNHASDVHKSDMTWPGTSIRSGWPCYSILWQVESARLKIFNFYLSLVTDTKSPVWPCPLKNKCWTNRKSGYKLPILMLLIPFTWMISDNYDRFYGRMTSDTFNWLMVWWNPTALTGLWSDDIRQLWLAYVRMTPSSYGQLMVGWNPAAMISLWSDDIQQVLPAYGLMTSDSSDCLVVV